MKLFKKILYCFISGAVAAFSLSVGAESVLNDKKTADSGKAFYLKLGTGNDNDRKIKFNKIGSLRTELMGAVVGIYVQYGDFRDEIGI